MARACLVAFAALLLTACTRQQTSGFVRITTENGRVYYADTERSIHSESGGFLAFRDLVTRESVKLKNGTYEAAFCPQQEVKVRQVEYLNDPTKPPRVEDYEEPQS